MTTTGETKSGLGAFAKGAIGAAALGVAGFFGTVFTNVLSAPKDTVAYDMVQSVTGMLKGGQTAAPAPATQRPAPAEPVRAAAAPAPATPAETLVAAVDPSVPSTMTTPPAAPKVSPPPAAQTPPTPSAPPAASTPAPPPSQPTVAATAPESASPGSMLDRVRQLGADVEKTRAKTAALAGARVLTLADRAETPLCGKTYQVEVTSVASGRAEVALRGPGEGPLTLSVGAPRQVAADCRVELLMAYEDLTVRRAQLRETAAR